MEKPSVFRDLVGVTAVVFKDDGGLLLLLLIEVVVVAVMIDGVTGLVETAVMGSGTVIGGVFGLGEVVEGNIPSV